MKCVNNNIPEIEKLRWADSALERRSRVIIDDRYILTIYVPEGYRPSGAVVNGRKAETTLKGSVLKVSYLPEETASVGWKISFSRDR